MKDIRIAAAQFEHRNGDKEYNLSAIRRLTEKAVAAGAEVVSFHECSITAYTFARNLSREQMLDLAEPIPDGPSTKKLMAISKEFGVPVLAGLFEKDGKGDLYKAYICVDGDKLVAKHRKLHAFINPHLLCGDSYTVFDLKGCRCGILICYDNNLIENVRMTTLLGAEIIFMPHVTCCLPSSSPGRGFVDKALWDNRDRDPVRLHQEFDGPKGRGWLMKWLPARAYDNGIYAIFTNPVGMDDDQVRNGNAMIIDPFGEITAECRTLGDDVVVGLCTPDKIPVSSGKRYLNARRPELYGKITESTGVKPVISTGWGIVREG